MQLAFVLNKYEGELICDFAEYYHVLNYKEISPELAAIFLVGLRNDSRVVMAKSGTKLTTEQTLLATIADAATYSLWMQGRCKGKKPKSILSLLTKDKQSKCIGFNSGKEFDKEWKRRMNHGKE